MSSETNEGASRADTEKAKMAINHLLGSRAIPEALLESWEDNNGFYTDNVVFYSTDTIVERNETLEVHAFCPGFLAIANDTGSRVALMKLAREADVVFLNYMGNMRPESMEDTGYSLKRWISCACPFELEPEPEISAVENVALRLDRVPDNGIKGLMNIKKLLNLNLSLQELRRIPENLPYRLCTTSYIGALRWAADINGEQECVSIWSEKDENTQLPLENPFEHNL